MANTRVNKEESWTRIRIAPQANRGTKPMIYISRVRYISIVRHISISREMNNY